MQSKDFKTFSYHAGKWESQPVNVIGEVAVTLTVNNTAWLTFMCTPNELEALALGFLYNEEIIDTLDEVTNVRVCPTGDNIDVWLNRPVQIPEKWTRTSGCSGGKTSADGQKSRNNEARSKNGYLLPPEVIGSLVKQLRDAQDLYRKTGGVHTSALSDGEKIIITTEDIGRHNTIDKLQGRCMLEGINLTKKIILTTGRISSEMIQKASRMDATVVISRTSPTTLSVEMAEKLGITLIGYARQDTFTVYTHPERILPITVGEKTIARQHDE
ncbi:MAG TPA: formate dehydrogenase accessory sulfurtransferase FdhD [Anaerolineales bacterium]|nr:formate dehydrogenase accessory sulfurtransferase FdhD [Anaerolineales bacterium]